MKKRCEIEIITKDGKRESLSGYWNGKAYFVKGKPHLRKIYVDGKEYIVKKIIEPEKSEKPKIEHSYNTETKSFREILSEIEKDFGIPENPDKIYPHPYGNMCLDGGRKYQILVYENFQVAEEYEKGENGYILTRKKFYHFEKEGGER